MPFPVPPPAPPPVVDILPPEESPRSTTTDSRSATPVAVAPVERDRSMPLTSLEELRGCEVELSCSEASQDSVAAAQLGQPVAVDIQTSFQQLQPERGQPEFAVISPVTGRTIPFEELDRLAQQFSPEPEPDDPFPAIPTVDEPAGEVITIPTEPTPPSSIEETTPSSTDTDEEPSSDAPSPDQPPQTGELAAPMLPEIVELRADRQEYDSIRQILVATGNVEMRFQGGVLAADLLRVNLPNRTAIAEGDVILTREGQVLRGERFNYNFGRQEGTIQNGRGEVDFAAAEPEFLPTLPTDVSSRASRRLLSDAILSEQPLGGVAQQGRLSVELGAGADDEGALDISGEVNRVRYEAEQIEFSGENWVATNVRLTNDPFSPPELELRSPRVTFTRINPTQSELRAQNPRLVFDRGLSLPFPLSRVVIGPRDQNPGLLQFGFDEEDRGGFYVERTFSILSSPSVRFSVTPQIYVQRAIDEDGFFSSSAYGFDAAIDAILSPSTVARGNVSLTSLDFSELEDNLRASVRVQQRVGDHGLNLEYSYRDRLFNGSLGYQNVDRSLGLVLVSPTYTLGTSGIELSYQTGVQLVTARTDQDDILEEKDFPEDNSVTLARYQGSVALNRGFLLWTGQPLPPTPTEGLRYTPTPVVPYLSAYTGVRALYSAYSSGDHEAALTGTVGLFGQFGHFSRPFFDYTAFNISYSLTALDGESPFLFDRINDTQVLSLGLVQQIYGPLRFGVQTSINLDREEDIDTDLSLEYVRRTFSVLLRFNPVRETGSLNLRVNNFNWTGNPAPFSGSDTIEGGVIRRNND